MSGFLGPVKSVPLDDIEPARLNDKVYRPVDPTAEDVIALSKSIRQNGLLQPIVVTADGVIVSGHRRRAACELAGLMMVPVQRLGAIRSTDPRFATLLVAFNAQRVKTVDEVAREVFLQTVADEGEAYSDLIAHRSRNASAVVEDVATLELGTRRARNRISKAKRPLLDAILRIVTDNRNYWPLNDRQVHYQLLNVEVLRHAGKPDSAYRNDRRSYKDACELITRARLTGEIPFEAIDDPTRPVTLWDCHPNVGPFLRREADGLFKGYWRDLLQSQPCHIEVIAEKLTVAPVVRRAAMDYCVPVTIGRGYASLSPRKKLYDRFVASHKDRLVLLFVSDFDPEGQDIAKSFGRSLRDDFGIAEHRITPVKAALSADQVRQFKLPPRMKAKKGSSRRAAFVAEHGENVFELEALSADVLEKIIREAIESVLDMNLFAREQHAEKAEAAQLQRLRETTKTILSGHLGGLDGGSQ